MGGRWRWGVVVVCLGTATCRAPQEEGPLTAWQGLVGQPPERAQAVEDFRAVHVDAGVHVVLLQGGRSAVDTAGAPDVSAHVQDGVLFVQGRSALLPDAPRGEEPRPRRWDRSGRRRVTVIGRGVGRIVARGSNTVEADELRVERLTIDASDKSTVDVSGQVDSLRVLARGGARVSARDLRAGRAVAHIPEAASVSIRVQDRVTGLVAGNGELDVFGRPYARDVHACDNGRVRYR